MSETSTITEAKPAKVEDILASIYKMREAIDHPPARIKVGSIEAFAAWFDRQNPMLRETAPGARVAVPSFSGVPVVRQDILPWYSAVLMVGDEVRAVFDLRDPSPTPKAPS